MRYVALQLHFEVGSGSYSMTSDARAPLLGCQREIPAPPACPPKLSPAWGSKSPSLSPALHPQALNTSKGFLQLLGPCFRFGRCVSVGLYEGCSSEAGFEAGPGKLGTQSLP